MNDKISDKDKQDWENFLKSKKKLQNKDVSNKVHQTYKTSSLDLHGHSLEGANKIVESFITKSYENGGSANDYIERITSEQYKDSEVYVSYTKDETSVSSKD